MTELEKLFKDFINRPPEEPAERTVFTDRLDAANYYTSKLHYEIYTILGPKKAEEFLKSVTKGLLDDYSFNEKDCLGSKIEISIGKDD